MEGKLEHAALEQEIARLSAEIKQMPPPKAEEGRETVKAALGTRIYEKGQEMPAVSTAQKEPQPSPILPNYLQAADPATKLKVEQLLDLAWHKGIKMAAAEAKKAGPLILDALHDALTDKFYDELKKRGVIK